MDMPIPVPQIRTPGSIRRRKPHAPADGRNPGSPPSWSRWGRDPRPRTEVQQNSADLGLQGDARMIRGDGDHRGFPPNLWPSDGCFEGVELLEGEPIAHPGDVIRDQPGEAGGRMVPSGHLIRNRRQRHIPQIRETEFRRGPEQDIGGQDQRVGPEGAKQRGDHLASPPVLPVDLDVVDDELVDEGLELVEELLGVAGEPDGGLRNLSRARGKAVVILDLVASRKPSSRSADA